MKSLLRTFHTVRHLAPAQALWLVRRRMLPAGRISEGPCRAVLARREAVLPAGRTSAVFDGSRMRLLGKSFPFEGERRWEPEGADRLWIYNLHYFAYLHAVDDLPAIALLRDWIESQHPGGGAGWDPYPISLRVREWIEWLMSHPELAQTDERLIVESIGRQLRALEARIEYELRGNHLLENGITFSWAGSSFEGADAERWRRLGLEILEAELSSQILPDGGHEERTPMYQALLAEALGRLAVVTRSGADTDSPRIHELSDRAARRMIQALAPVVHPDRDYAQLNDTALGIAPLHHELVAAYCPDLAAERLAGAFSLEHSGYLGFHDPSGAALVFDAGPIGPDHQPGHGHADSLTFELSVGGRRLITDTGVGSYELGAARAHDRSTAAHNTVEIDERNQSDVWAAFRCGRRIQPVASGVESHAESSSFKGGYRGPGLARAGVRHARTMTLSPDRLLIRDQIRSPGRHRAAWRLHLAPGISVRRDAKTFVACDESGRFLAAIAEAHGWREHRSPYHPSFNAEVERCCLEAALRFEDEVDIAWEIRFR